MKKIKFLFSAAFALLSLTANAQQTVTIQGKVKFVQDGFKMQVYQRDGTSKKVLAEVPVNADNTRLPFRWKSPARHLLTADNGRASPYGSKTRTWTSTSVATTLQKSKSKTLLSYIYAQERRMR